MHKNGPPDVPIICVRTPKRANPCPDGVKNSARTPQSPIRVRTSQYQPGIIYNQSQHASGLSITATNVPIFGTEGAIWEGDSGAPPALDNEEGRLRTGPPGSVKGPSGPAAARRGRGGSVAGQDMKCRRSVYLGRPATLYATGSRFESQVRERMQTRDGLATDLRHFGRRFRGTAAAHRGRGKKAARCRRRPTSALQSARRFCGGALPRGEGLGGGNVSRIRPSGRDSPPGTKNPAGGRGFR